MTSAVTDFGQFASLRASADRQDPAVLREVASQFEALFVQSMLKNMRGAELAEPMFGSDQMDMYQDMFDQQLSLEMASGKGLGLADMLVRQLGGEGAALPTPQQSYAVPAPQTMRGAVANIPTWTDPDQFVSDVWPHAKRAAARLDVAPEALVAQAALETGWGAHVMRDRRGASTFNLFGIKADSNWQGDKVAKSTLEFEDGVASRRVEKFRSYPDVAAVFDDYATLISGKARYADVSGKGADTGGFAAALQEAGYATDPRYAEKIERVLNGETMRQALGKLKNSPAQPITAGLASVASD
ncbi:MAG: glucosaminidase domain-containing protein [Woeseia sp.]